MKRSEAAFSLIALLAMCAPVTAGEDNRRILALFDSAEKRDMAPGTNDVHLRMEKPLNWLGMTVDHWDVNQRPLPDATRYRAIIVWLIDDRMLKPTEYLRWIRKALRNGVRLVVIDGLGAGLNPTGKATDWEAVKATYREFGFEPDDSVEPTNNPFIIDSTDHKPERFGFETRIPPKDIAFTRMVPVDKRVRVWRSVRRSDVGKSEGAAIAVGPRGGLALDFRYMVRITERPFYLMMWDVDPFAFMEASLDCRDTLRPDVTTVCGARAAYSHIDGDGLNNMTLDIPGKPRFAGEVILEEVLRRFPVPVTAGPIACHVDLKLRTREGKPLATPALVGLVRKILSPPNIQPGCHGYAHPLHWAKGIPYFRWKGYRFSAAFETTEAMRKINSIVPGSRRRVEIFLWTGDCMPTEEALAECERMGVANLNGGDARYDNKYRSITNIAPLYRTVGPYRHIYASAQNENTYTGLWTRNFGGYRAVIQTFKRTESPRRLLPVNIYYHFYSGERLAALRAVQTAYRWALEQPLCWIHAAEYARSVKGFITARCGRTDDGGYWIEDFGPCPTARLDHCLKNVDMERATGVIGFTHHAGSLYVSLAPVKRAAFRLCAEKPKRPCLRRSTALLRKVRSGRTGWSAEARLYAPGFVELQGLAPSAARTVHVGSRTRNPAVGRQGVLTIRLPAGSGQWVEVRVAP